MSKVFSTLTIAFLILGRVQAQQVNYTVTKNDPSFDNIPNLYITPNPLLSIDFPMWGPNPDAIMSSSVFGIGIRNHALIGEKYQADLNFHQGLWPAKTRYLELGGAMIFKSHTEQKSTNIVLSREVKSVYTDAINYTTVPYTELKFSGVRGGLMHYKSIFDFKDGSFDNNLNAKPSAVGHTNSIGIYGGLTWGKIADLHIQLEDGRKRNHSIYHQFYADILLAAHSHNYQINTTNKKVLPIGFRIGGDVYKPTVGIMGKGTKFINAEIGYRPGYDGVYAKVSFWFMQIRRNVSALRE